MKVYKDNAKCANCRKALRCEKIGKLVCNEQEDITALGSIDFSKYN